MKLAKRGWDPPTDVSKETWQAAKSLPDTDPMKAFCGFGCSFGGKWFGGYMKHAPGKSERIYTTRGLKRDCMEGAFDLVDFLAVEPQPTAALLYLDPPYAGTTGYAGGGTGSDRCERLYHLHPESAL